MKLPTIVGIAGTNGAGKDVLGALLHERCGYDNISLSDILRAELDRRGQEHSRENLSGLSREIREQEGDGAMSRRVITEWQDNGDGRGLCITSIRTHGEATTIQQAGGVIIWVDADPKTRYERVTAAGRGRGATDDLSFAEFMEQQEREMTPTAKGGGLNMAAVRECADVMIDNNFATKEAYENYLIETFEL